MAQTEVEPGRNSRITYKHGDTLSQQQFTDLILGQHEIAAIKLFTLSYDMPFSDGNARKIHRHLLALADEGVAVTVAVDNTYGRRVAPKSDLPIPIAKLLGERKILASIRATYEELNQHPNIDLIYLGSEHPPFFPLSKIDHRKILLVYKGDKPDFGAIFGSSINYHLDTSIGSAAYMSDPEVLEWLDNYSKTPHYTAPTQTKINGLTITTRELVPGGNDLADKEITDVINNAHDNLLFSSQWLPDGKTLDGIAKAVQRGVTVAVFSNFVPINRQPLASVVRMKALHRLAAIARQTGNLQFFVPQDHSLFVHLNALVADRHDPKLSRAITGTDNMTNQLLQKLGLRETLLTLNDPLMVANFVAYIENYLVPACREFNLYSATWKTIIVESLPHKGLFSKERCATNG
jgi:phosphatidylserine/phosphatidylglycerophosphate/cardiolipin synthase-like enzyme